MVRSVLGTENALLDILTKIDSKEGQVGVFMQQFGGIFIKLKLKFVFYDFSLTSLHIYNLDF